MDGEENIGVVFSALDYICLRDAQCCKIVT